MAFRTRTHFWSSVNICNVNMAEIFRTFKISFKMKCNRDSNMPIVLVISRIVNLLSISITFFYVRHLPCLVQQMPAVFCFLTDFAPVSFFLHLQTVSRYLIRHINFLQFSTNPHYRMTDFCANCYIRSNCQFF